MADILQTKVEREPENLKNVQTFFILSTHNVVIKKLNVNPANCVFIDDREKNLLPAMKMGMKVIKFLREDDKCSIDDIPAIKDFYELEDVVETLI